MNSSASRPLVSWLQTLHVYVPGTRAVASMVKPLHARTNRGRERPQKKKTEGENMQHARGGEVRTYVEPIGLDRVVLRRGAHGR